MNWGGHGHRLNKGIPSLRRQELLRLFQKCAGRAKRYGLHVVHYALESNHIHLIVEARDNRALRSGMVSLFGSFARALNERVQRVGKVYSDRYHLNVITNPSQMKHTLRYVLLNHCKHTKWLEHMDPFSSARFFPHWKNLIELNEVVAWDLRNLSENYASAGLSPPRSWLAAQGWMRARS